MKIHLIAILILTAGCLSASAQYEQYVTLNVAPPNNPPTSDFVTNTFSINQGQAAQITSYFGSQAYSFYTISNNGAIFSSEPLPSYFGPNPGAIIQGPATFTLNSSGGFNALLTLKIIPEAYDPNKTLIVPPGTNHVQITL